MLHLYDPKPDRLDYLDEIQGDMEKAREAARLGRTRFEPRVVVMSARLREELRRGEHAPA